MAGTHYKQITRKSFLQGTGAAFAGLAAGQLSAFSQVISNSQEPLRIGIIGSGRIGGAVGLKWAEAGHHIFFSSRHPEELTDLVASAGEHAQAGLPDAAARFGDVILIAVPYACLLYTSPSPRD